MQILKDFPDSSVDCVITDPPYGISFQSNFRNDKFDYLKNDDNLEWLSDFVEQTYRVLKDNTHFYCFCRWDVYHKFYEAISKKFSIKNCLIIKRVNASMGDLEGQFAYFYEMCIFAHKGRRIFNDTNLIKKNGKSHPRYKGDKSIEGYIQRYPDLIESIPSGENRYIIKHPTQKSEAICRLFILLSSNTGEVILDPFAGSGTTLISAQQLNRRWVGIEVNREYVSLINQRMKQQNIHHFSNTLLSQPSAEGSLISVKRESMDSPNSPQIDNTNKEEANFS